jgi:hypothetical protein
MDLVRLVGSAIRLWVNDSYPKQAKLLSALMLFSRVTDVILGGKRYIQSVSTGKKQTRLKQVFKEDFTFVSQQES